METDKPSPAGPPAGGLSSGLKDTGFLLGWILGLILIGGLLWFFTQPLRTRLVIRSVNRVLASLDEPRRLDDAISPWGLPGQGPQLGSWYILAEADGRAVVFPMMNEGILASFIAILSPEGTVDALLPLSANAVRILERLPPGTVQTYKRRIEGSEALISNGGRGK
ncbi:MAG: hypothetical protein LBP93_08635 [Treponema sp.]|nr:hypothetical protein [Treponema sp.]